MNDALSFLLLGDNVAFATALAIMAALGLVSAIGLEFHADVDADIDGLPMLDWLNPGGMPMLAGLATTLAVYGIVGLAGQQAWQAATGATMDALPASLAAILPALAIARPVSRGLAKVMPRDETTAIEIDELVGRRGDIEIGVARVGSPARARFRDRHGQVHYLMVEPNVATQTLTCGQEIMLVAVGNGVGRAIEVDARPDFTI